MAEPTVSAGYPRAFLDFAVSRGADRRSLVERSGLAGVDLSDQDGRVPLARYVALIEAGIDLTREPALALHFGEAVRPEDVTIVALITMASETVADVFEQMGRYGRLMIDGGAGSSLPLGRLSEEPDGIWLVSTNPAFVGHPYLEQILLAQNFCGARRVMGRAADGMLIHCLQEAPSYAAEFERILGAPIVFGAGRHAVRLPEAVLSQKVPTANRYVFGLLSERAEALLASLEEARTARAEVERALARVLHTGQVGLDSVARQLGMSPKTLYRRLKAEGTSYARVLDDLRHRLAVAFLAEQKVSVSEAAYLTGFSEPAAFSRAFRRWTGARPGAARARGTP
ncbi:AraC family transcriptional regulator ligand-binding domain-containing protein [Phenylobacterium terrae]|uniref:AraC family transcriptional regulator ligand-binding domain-containing protein n=1 Tax=Phenylobacterium terrae TaxID=2665495 RepID=A0ABW4N552_9CAUL